MTPYTPTISRRTFVASAAIALTACGGGSSSGEPAATNDPTPVVQDQSVVPQQPNDPQNPHDPQVPPDPLPQEPETPALPIANQTGWNLSGIESRKPLELLKTLMCSQLASMQEVAPPRSDGECDTIYPNLQSGTEEGLPVFEAVPPGTELVKREGCTFVPSEEKLVCGWSHVMAFPENSTNYYRVSTAYPFIASFSLEVENCPADKPHYFGMTISRAPAQSSGPVVKAPPAVPSGCVEWTDLVDFFYHTEASVYAEPYSPN